MQNQNLENLFKILDFNPKRIVEPYAWVGHIPFASWLIQQIQPKIFVELGVHSGNSYFSVCQSAKEFHVQIKCYAVDTWLGERHAGKYSEDIFLDVTRHNQENYNQFSTLLRKDFDSAVNDFEDSTINLLHIDGLHTYEAVKHDFETWLPKLAPGAVVMFHDVCEKNGDFGVWKLWEELKINYSDNLLFNHSHGLGLIRVKQEMREGEEKLFSKEFYGLRIIKFFEACGDLLESNYKYKKYDERIINCTEDLARYHIALTNKDREITKLIDEIGRYHIALTNKDREITKLMDEISRYHIALTKKNE